MEWSDEGIVLAVRMHGEDAAVVSLLTRLHGRYAGLVRGARGSRSRGVYEPGNLVAAVWRARLEDHLGSLRAELVTGHAAGHFDDPGRLAALTSAAALADAVMPERVPHPEGFDALLALVAGLPEPGWAERYVRWELGLLADLGFGLDLGSCAATGRKDDLCWVSPKSGRAVSRSAGEAYRDKLLPLPAFLAGGRLDAGQDLLDGLRLTGYFLARHVLPERDLPAPRNRLLERLARTATISGRGT